MAGGNVPDFDGAVPTAAGDKLVVRRKSNGVDPVIETSVIFLLCSLKNHVRVAGQFWGKIG